MIVFIPATESISHLVGTSQSHVASFAGGLHTLFTGLECPGSRSLGPAALFLVILLVVAAMVLMASWSLIYEKFSSVTFDRTSGSIRKKKYL